MKDKVTLSMVMMLDQRIKTIDPTYYLTFEPETAEVPPSYTIWQEGQPAAIARHFDYGKLGVMYAPDAYVPDQSVSPRVPVRVDRITVQQQEKWALRGQLHLAQRAIWHDVRELLDLGAVRWYFTHVYAWVRKDKGERIAQRTGALELDCSQAPACTILRQDAKEEFTNQAVAATRPWLMLGAQGTASWQFPGATPAVTTSYGDYSLAMYEDHGLHLVILGVAQFVEALGLEKQWLALGWRYRRLHSGFELY